MKNPRIDVGLQVARRSLFGSAAAAALVGAGPGDAAPAPARTEAEARAESASPYAYLIAPEAAFVEAAVDHFIPPDGEGPGGLEAGVALFIDGQLNAGFGNADRMYMSGPFAEGTPQQGYQSSLRPREIYRVAIAEIDAHCRRAHDGKVLAALSPNMRETVFQDLLSGKIVLPTTDGAAFVGMLLDNTVEGYFADPKYGGNRNMGAWRMIGFPGARADYRAIVGQPDATPPSPLDLAPAATDLAGP